MYAVEQINSLFSPILLRSEPDEVITTRTKRNTESLLIKNYVSSDKIEFLKNPANLLGYQSRNFADTTTE